MSSPGKVKTARDRDRSMAKRVIRTSADIDLCRDARGSALVTPKRAPLRKVLTCSPAFPAP